MNSIRSFVAIDLSSETKQALQRVILNGKKIISPNKVRWTRENNLHLTLKFLGEIQSDQVRELIQELTRISSNQQPFGVDLSKMGVFPNPVHASILWVGMDSHPGLTQLAARVDEAAFKIHVPPETRPFSPHLTLGRVNRSTSEAEVRLIAHQFLSLSVRDIPTTVADHLTLYRSRLHPDGPQYSPLAECPFGAASI